MSKPDWEAIETAYRAGVMSLREIASQHGISEGAIRKRAKRDDWSRDLVAKVKERADDLVRKAEVRKQVRTETSLSGRVLIEATAEVVAAVRMEHRGDIRRARELTNTLFDELAGECGDVAEKYIRTKNRKAGYVFCGLRHNLGSIKSKASFR